jgi:hypothetical protein
MSDSEGTKLCIFIQIKTLEGPKNVALCVTNKNFYQRFREIFVNVHDSMSTIADIET